MYQKSKGVPQTMQRENGKDEYLAEITSVPPVLKTAEEMASISQIQPQIKNIVSSYRMQWVLDGDADDTFSWQIQFIESLGTDQKCQGGIQTTGNTDYYSLAVSVYQTFG